MLRNSFLFLLLALSGLLAAQLGSPISWTFSSEALPGGEYELTATAHAEAGWAIYSQFTAEGGPVPTTFYWEEGDHYERLGRTEEDGHKKEGMDELFGVEVSKFLSDRPVVFTQRVRVKDFGTPIKLTVEYMCCDDEQCLPPTDEEHAFTLAPAGPGRGETSPAPPAAPPAKPTRADVVPKNTPKPSAAPQPAPPLPQEQVHATYTYAQTAPTEENPVSWVLTAEALDGGRYRLHLTGTLADRWTIYSQEVDPMIGPIPTELIIERGRPEAAPTETSPNLKRKYDRTWEAEVAKIDGGSVTYSQVVAADGLADIGGVIVFQACDDEMCLPPRDLPFALDLGGPVPVASIDGMSANGGAATAAVGTDDPAPGAEAGAFGGAVTFNSEPVGSCSVGATETRGEGLLSIFGLGLLGGLFALLMPCIFPMIPLTVSFFTKSGGTRARGIRDASLYGFFIFLIYVLLSLPFHLIDGLDPGILNNIASNVWLNLVFFLVFLFFAGSFFGFYELTLPESWSNRASAAEGTGGTVGIFFMALTLALVSFSCTGPILGSLLVEAVSGGATPLTAGMAGFGVALGLPFALFAAFPQVLDRMPKSGGWLNSVKVVLGFVEVALAFKFLSNADLVGHWDLLRIEPFLVIWMLCSLGIAAYLFGWISFPLDSKQRRTGPAGLAVAVLGVLFTAYLAYGLTNDRETNNYRNLSLLSGIAPPVCYSYFNSCDCPQNITCFKDLEAGLAYAREVDKPVMLDFTGYTCVNCRKMEENVWSQREIKDILTEDYVLISLYVDDRAALPAAEHRQVTRLDGSGRTKLIDQVGEKWHYFQQRTFARASQPYYVLVSPDGQTLNPPVAYTPVAEDYADFLRCGLATFRELRSK